MNAATDTSGLQLDLGCGPRKAEGYQGCDRLALPGVDHVFDIGKARWPFADNSVAKARSSHFLEHLTSIERAHFFNELYRVLEPGALCQIITPHWASNRAYGDPTHQWPPVSEMTYIYLSKQWRLANAIHTDAQYWPQGYACDFAVNLDYALHPVLKDQPEDVKKNALLFNKEAAQDMVAIVKKL